jgi:hypothetical protein
MAGGTAVVGAVAGAAGAGATALISGKVDGEGKRTRKSYKRATEEEVNDDDIHFNEEA